MDQTVPESCPGRRDGRIHPFYLKIIKQLWFWGSDPAQEWTPFWLVPCCHQTQREVSSPPISAGMYCWFLAQNSVVTSYRLVWLPGLWETPFLFISFSTVLGWIIGLTGWRL